VMLRMYAAWIEGATDADIQMIKRRWMRVLLRERVRPLSLRVPRQIGRKRSS
jgi:hypothetical protein